MILRLRDVLSAALGNAGLQTTSEVWQLAELWSSTLGPRIAQRASPVRLARGELVIAVADAVWRQELAFLGPEIASRLNRALGREVVQRIRLVGGDVTAGPASDATSRPRRLFASSTSGSGGTRPVEPPEGAELSGDLADALESLRARRAARLAADSRGAKPARQRSR